MKKLIVLIVLFILCLFCCDRPSITEYTIPMPVEYDSTCYEMGIYSGKRLNVCSDYFIIINDAYCNTNDSSGILHCNLLFGYSEIKGAYGLLPCDLTDTIAPTDLYYQDYCDLEFDENHLERSAFIYLPNGYYGKIIIKVDYIKATQYNGYWSLYCRYCMITKFQLDKSNIITM